MLKKVVVVMRSRLLRGKAERLLSNHYRIMVPV